VIETDPLATAVTRPDVETDATATSLDDQVTGCPDIALPFWSFTVAVNCEVSPREERVRFDAERAIDVASGLSGFDGSVGEEPDSPPVQLVVVVRTITHKAGATGVRRSMRGA
jgi:hypothetical protein